VFFARGRGAYLTDLDGHRYLDLVGSWGANLLGNAPPRIVTAVRRAAAQGLTFGAPSPREHEFAERLRDAAPELERLRFVSSGTEAVMSAVRLARGYTGRSKVVKMAGGYHGHSDGLLARAGSGVAASGLPDSVGVPASIAAETLVVPYNDGEALAATLEAWPDHVAAVLVEPVAGNMGVVPPRPGYLAELSRRAHNHGALVLADEVITGFRLRRGTIHRELGLRADLVTLGKVIGGGLPVGAYGGRRAIMDHVAPEGPVYQAGTLSGNPVAMAAGAAMLGALTPPTYRRLERNGQALEAALRAGAGESGTEPFTLHRFGSMLGLFFGPGPVLDLASAQRADAGRYRRFFHAALRHGVYFPPSPLETTFVSAATGPGEIARAAAAFAAGFHAARARS
jgi:glutamate-1-semialdehyde 2,1-aminomutase